MLGIFSRMHHESGMNPHMEEFIKTHQWGMRMIPPHELPDYDDEIYFNDPFDRIIDFDQDRIRWWRERMRRNMPVPPIMLGPDHSIIDGNHRAQAARSMNQPIQAYVPMRHDEFVVESDLNYMRKLAGI